MMHMKGKIKKALGAVGLSVCLLGAAAPARAGIPVIDTANLMQAIMEMIAWGQQAMDMVASIQEARNMVAGIQTTISKLDGPRNLGSILNDPNIRSAMPAEMQNAVGVLMNPTGVTPSAASLSNVLSAFGITVPTTGITRATELADVLLKNQGLLQSGRLRESQLQQLASRVDSAADIKESSDLIARNLIENARIVNVLSQQLATQELAKQQAKLRAIAATQAERNRATSYFSANPLP